MVLNDILLLLLLHVNLLSQASLRAKLLHLIRNRNRRLRYLLLRLSIANLLNILNTITALVPSSWIDVDINDSTSSLRCKLVRLSCGYCVSIQVFDLNLKLVLWALIRHRSSLLTNHIVLVVHWLITHHLRDLRLLVVHLLLLIESIDL